MLNKSFKNNSIVSIFILAAISIATSACSEGAKASDAKHKINPKMATPSNNQTSDKIGAMKPVNPENILVIDTTKGRILIELSEKTAPNHVARIKTLAHQGFYNGQIFHRVIDGFMDQTGDPTGTGMGGSKLPDLKEEFIFKRGASFPYTEGTTINGLSKGWVGSLPVSSQPSSLMNMTKDKTVQAAPNHCSGVASMARASSPDSANSQFFLMRNDSFFLDGQYTAWGKAVSGLDVIQAINKGEPPKNPDKMIKVQVLSDIKANAPKVFIEDTNSPEFKQRLAKEVAAKGSNFSNCDFGPAIKIEQ